MADTDPEKQNETKQNLKNKTKKLSKTKQKTKNGSGVLL